MLIYLSADGSKVYTTQPQDYGYDLGGVLLNNKPPVVDPNAPPPPPPQQTTGKRGEGMGNYYQLTHAPPHYG